MAITQLPRFAPSKKPYAFAWDTYRVDSTPMRPSSTQLYHRAHVEAVWVGRKNGATYVCAGDVGLGASFPDPDDLWIEAFRKHFDPRYGGDPVARWNGHNLWAPGVSIADANRWHEFLAPLLADLPDVPDGFDGWYSLR